MPTNEESHQPKAHETYLHRATEPSARWHLARPPPRVITRWDLHLFSVNKGEGAGPGGTALGRPPDATQPVGNLVGHTGNVFGHLRFIDRIRYIEGQLSGNYVESW